jgi:hypothetical protein
VDFFTALFTALDRAHVRYVVVGGLATVLHGHPRLTADVDLVIDLGSEPSRRAVTAFQALGLKPRAPVSLLDFADPEKRRFWADTKSMRVFSLYDPAQPMREVDLFVREPLDFEELWRASEAMDLGPCKVHVASIPHLIALKRVAGRPQDLLDIEALEEIRKRRKETDRG